MKILLNIYKNIEKKLNLNFMGILVFIFIIFFCHKLKPSKIKNVDDDQKDWVENPILEIFLRT